MASFVDMLKKISDAHIDIEKSYGEGLSEILYSEEEEGAKSLAVRLPPELVEAVDSCAKFLRIPRRKLVELALMDAILSMEFDCPGISGELLKRKKEEVGE